MSHRYWLATVPLASWSPPSACVAPLAYLKGQQERGEGGYEHWQLLLVFSRNVRLSQAKLSLCNDAHLEPSRSAAADAYVWKEDTRIGESQFELGAKPMRRNVKPDWDSVLAAAKRGDFADIPSDIVVRCYSQLTRIAKDYMAPVAVERQVTGTKCRFVFTGEELALEKVELPGMKQAWALILRIHPQNGGMDTEVSSMLYSMNFEVGLQSNIFLDGSIDTLWLWKPKEEPPSSELLTYGLPQIYRLINGILS